MLASARRRAWRMAGVCALPPARGGFVGRAISPAAGALRHRRAFRDDASIVPYEAQGKVLPGFAGHFCRQAAMHPSVCALRRIHRPVCGARIALRALKHTCVLRPLHYREAVKTGAVSD